MDKIINLSSTYRYCVYEHKIQLRKELSTYRMIVIKNEEDRIVRFTGLEQFSYPYTGQLPKIAVRQKAELAYICRALNYIFSHNRAFRIADITADMVLEFFDAYCNSPKKRSEEIMLSQQSMDSCVRHVTSFFCNLAVTYQTKIIIETLMIYEDTRANRHSRRIVRRYYPRYVPKRPHSWNEKLLRDMPLDAAYRLVELAWIHDPMIAFGIILQLYAGMRPGCVVNMRQVGSPVSTTPCFRFAYIGSAVSGIEIDLTHEYVLRSDGVSVGRIKKERVVEVFKPFIPEVYKGYQFHMNLLSGMECEPEYMPMFIGSTGKAMTYNTYSKRVKALVYNHLKPELYESADPEQSAFAHLLESYRWAPHTLRHCFTVKLVQEKLDVAQVQFYRGDKSPESAITYVMGKGELNKSPKPSHAGAIRGLEKVGRLVNDAGRIL